MRRFEAVPLAPRIDVDYQAAVAAGRLDGALPSETFVPNRLADEPYAEEAILVKVEDYDALVIPGGRAPEYLRLDERVLQMVRHFAGRFPHIPAVSR